MGAQDHRGSDMSNYNEFTEEDKAFLRKHYSTKGAEWCSKHIPHSKHSVKTKANKMGLKLTKAAKRRALGPAALQAREAQAKKAAQAALVVGLPEEYLQAPSIWRVAQRFESDGRWRA